MEKYGIKDSQRDSTKTTILDAPAIEFESPNLNIFVEKNKARRLESIEFVNRLEKFVNDGGQVEPVIAQSENLIMPGP